MSMLFSTYEAQTMYHGFVGALQTAPIHAVNILRSYHPIAPLLRPRGDGTQHLSSIKEQNSRKV